MAYLLAADFRPDTLTEYTAQLGLSTSDVASNTVITAAIARQSQHFDDLTNDHFEKDAAATLTLRGNGTTILTLPRRCTALTSVSITNSLGTVTAQTAGTVRLHSSLDTAGAKRIGNPPSSSLDWLETVPYKWLSGATFGPTYGWPDEPNSILVVGDFGWTTTPADVKRAVALMVYNQFKSQADVLGMATSVTDAGATYNLAGVPPEASDIIADYKYGSTMLVA